jgi:hypothetical protein
MTEYKVGTSGRNIVSFELEGELILTHRYTFDEFYQLTNQLAANGVRFPRRRVILLNPRRLVAVINVTPLGLNTPQGIINPIDIFLPFFKCTLSR